MSKQWLAWSAIGLLLFVCIQVFPGSGSLFASGGSGMLSREEAKAAALAAAKQRFGAAPANPDDVEVTHLSDSASVGYLSKQRLLDDYDKIWDARFPTDVYRVDIPLGAGRDRLELSLHMKSGALVAWRFEPDAAGTGGTGADGTGTGASGANAADAADARSAADLRDGRTASDREIRLARDALQRWGYDPQEWEPTGKLAADGAVVFQARKAGLGEAKLQLYVKAETPAAPSALGGSAPDAASEDSPSRARPGGELRYRLLPPASFAEYWEEQNKAASRLSIYGSLLPQLALFVLAVVYAKVCGGWTSYRRGVFLASLFFVLYVGFTLNMAPAFRAQAIEQGLFPPDAAVGGYIVVNIVMLAAMALLTYVSAVAGDGLWKAMGRNLWPRWRQPGYGRKVLASMGQGYVLAFILLGAQSVILLALTQLLGSFTSSDVTQSTYNMTYPWLLPLLAWCAGISEELQTRLFGIGLFRRWLTGGARRLLRREPSRRAAAVLTVAAMLPPSLLWAFGHAGYAVYPFYTRLIELTLLGLLFGWFMLRFGLMTVIFAHVTLDATLMGVQLMLDGLPYGMLSGLFSLLMPALAGWAIWRLHRRLSSRPA